MYMPVQQIPVAIALGTMIDQGSLPASKSHRKHPENGIEDDAPNSSKRQPTPPIERRSGHPCNQHHKAANKGQCGKLAWEVLDPFGLVAKGLFVEILNCGRRGYSPNDEEHIRGAGE
jgi:hypothetical protein